MMSVSVLEGKGRVGGVIQISRKGFDVPLAGPDFTSEDLQTLELAGRIVGRFLATTGSAG